MQLKIFRYFDTADKFYLGEIWFLDLKYIDFLQPIRHEGKIY